MARCSRGLDGSPSMSVCPLLRSASPNSAGRASSSSINWSSSGDRATSTRFPVLPCPDGIDHDAGRRRPARRTSTTPLGVHPQPVGQTVHVYRRCGRAQTRLGLSVGGHDLTLNRSDAPSSLDRRASGVSAQLRRSPQQPARRDRFLPPRRRIRMCPKMTRRPALRSLKAGCYARYAVGGRPAGKAWPPPTL